MITFSFIARDPHRGQVSDSVEAHSRFEALEKLREQGLTVFSLSENGSGEHDAADIVIHRKHQTLIGVSLGEKAILFRQLSVAVGAGVPLREALQSIAKDIRNSILRFTLNDVIDRIHDGATFAEAIVTHPHIFDASMVALIHAAEESGSMEKTLDEMASALEDRCRMKRKLRSIIAYPVFVMVFFVIVCTIMTIFVMPQFQDVFSEFDTELPLITRSAFAINTFLLANMTWILGGLAAAIAAMWLAARSRTGRGAMDVAVLKMPFFGTCIHKLMVARMCRTLSMLIRGGVPIAYAIELASAVSANTVFRRAVMNVHDKVVNGMSISESIAGSWLFPNLVSRMVSVGESSGKLPHVLDKVGETYENEVESSFMVAMALFEPIIIVLFGAIILLLVLAIYMPVFTVAAGVK